jgi:shikimate dehydrogenase
VKLALGLIGYPLEGSQSPRLHAENLRRAGLQGAYTLYRVPPLPEGQAALAELIARLRRGELHGLNVTLPHKQSVLPLLDRLTPAAQRIGAVNTLYAISGQVWGDNTDAPGFWADLNERFPQLFAGTPAGRARAVADALLSHGWQVTLAARRPAQAAVLLQDFAAFAPHLAALPFARLAEAAPAQLLVNATSAGMLPEPDSCPWPDGLPLPAGVCAYDLVYKPPHTRFLQLAQQAGLPYANGMGMLEKQARLAFAIWVQALA